MLKVLYNFISARAEDWYCDKANQGKLFVRNSVMFEKREDSELSCHWGGVFEIKKFDVPKRLFKYSIAFPYFSPAGEWKI